MNKLVIVINMIVLLIVYKNSSRHISGVFPIYCGAYVERASILQRVIELACCLTATSYPERNAKYVVN